MEKISNAGTMYKESKYYYWEATAGQFGQLTVAQIDAFVVLTEVCVDCFIKKCVQRFTLLIENLKPKHTYSCLFQPEKRTGLF